MERDDRHHREPLGGHDLPHVGSGRHFSWSILEDLEAAEDPRRATSGVRVLDSLQPLLSREDEQALGARVRAGTDASTGELDPDARAAVRSLVVANLRLCVRPARSRLRHGQDFDDIIQNGFFGLIRAAEKFDADLGNRFSTYAMIWIRQQMDRGVDREARQIRVPSHVTALQRRIDLAEAQGLIEDNMALEDIARIVKAEAAHVDVALEARHEIVGFDEAEEDNRARSFLDPRRLEPDTDDDADEGWAESISYDTPTEPTAVLSAHVLGLILNLEERERIIVELYYGLADVEPHTLEEIAEYFDLTRERVRQMRNRALESLRRELALERSREPDFDDHVSLGADEALALASDDIVQYVAEATSDRAGARRTDVAASRPVDPAKERQKVVRAVLGEIRESTAQWSSEPLLATEPAEEDRGDVLRHITRLTEEEPFRRHELVAALADIVDDVGPQAIGDALLAVVRSAARAALRDGLPREEELSRLLRLARFVGCSADPLAYDIVLRAAPLTTIELPEKSRVASTWHFDENDPAHVDLRETLHRHGDRLQLRWSTSFDPDLDLVIASDLSHRSWKTFCAVLAGIPICDFDGFLSHEPGQLLTVLRSPTRIAWTYWCRKCQLIESRERTSSASCPSHCRNCEG